eukprot:847517-Amphidinium_carterae.1
MTGPPLAHVLSDLLIHVSSDSLAKCVCVGGFATSVSRLSRMVLRVLGALHGRLRAADIPRLTAV